MISKIKKILLIQVPTSHLGAGEKVYPLGLSRIAGVIPESIKKYSLDMNLFQDPWPELKNRIETIKPDLVALSFRNLDPLAGHHTSYLASLKTSAQMIRKLLPNCRIIAGGTAFSLFGNRLMEEIPEIDMGVQGEGEGVFHNFLNNGSDDPTSLPGFVWRNGSKIVANPLENKRIAMDMIPGLDQRCFPPEDYIAENKYVAAMGIEGKRGCDLKCSYCVYPVLGGRSMRLRSPQRIVDEMEELNKQFGVVLFHFTDSVVNRPVGHFRQVCEEILNRKLNIHWTGFFREADLDERTLELAQKAGLAAIYFSADGLTEHGLKILNKRLSKEHIFQASRITAKSGIITVCHFLVNLPEEHEVHAKESFDTMNRILEIYQPHGNLGAVIFNNIRLYPGAPLTARLLKNNILDPKTDLLYPVYFNPPEKAAIKHKLENLCHTAGVFSRLKMPS